MLLDLLNQEYLSRSSDQNSAELKNMYLEADPAKGKYKYIALPTPGLTLFSDTAQSSIRAMLSVMGVLYVIAGNKFYSINSSGTTTELGTLNTSSGTVKMRAITGASDTNHQIIIIDGTNGYHYNTSTSTATFPITDVDFPQDAIDLEVQDDYFIVAKNNSIQYQISNLSDGLSWSALDFASKYGQADGLNSIVSHESKLWLFGEATTEISYNSGDSNFPFTRISDTFLHYGNSAKATIATNGNYFIFVGSNSKGGYSVMQTSPRIYSYNPTPISTPPIDFSLGALSTVSDLFGTIYNFAGHEFYEVTSPTGNITFVYDIPKVENSTELKGVWYKRESNNSGTYGRFLGNCRAFCYGKRLIGDFNSGKIYYEDSNSYTENGTAIRRQFISSPGQTYAGGKRVFFFNLVIDVETGIGSNKTFTLEKSIDSGTTWQLVNTYTVPDKGGRIYENRLGSSKTGMIFRLTTTMNAKFAILGFQCEMVGGHNNG